MTRYSDPDDVRFPCFAQGARCGHIEGKDRVGSYVLGEEQEWAHDTGEINAGHLPRDYRDAWSCGYSYGYKLGAEGSALPAEIEHADLP